jgi:hypothetical protein
MDLSICIVSWNTKALLKECIQSILDITSGLEYEIIIVDNGSTDGSPEMVENAFTRCKLIRSQANLGFAKANNLAVTHASGRYILYLNPDTKLISNILPRMCDYLNRNPLYGAVGCKLLNTDGSLQYTCARAYPSPLREFNELAMLNRLFPRTPLFSSIEMHYWDHEDSRDIDCLSGACIMVRKEVEMEINGFDEDYFMYAEDVDLCYRIVQKGWKIYYLADGAIIHHQGASTRGNKAEYYGTVEPRRSVCRFIRKHQGQWKALGYQFAVFLGSAIRMGVIPIYLLYNRTFRKDNTVSMGDLFCKYYMLLRWSLRGNDI